MGQSFIPGIGCGGPADLCPVSQKMKVTVVVEHYFPVVPTAREEASSTPKESQFRVTFISEMWLQIFLTAGIQLCENNKNQKFVMVSGINQRSNNLASLRKAQSGMVYYKSQKSYVQYVGWQGVQVSVTSTALSVEKSSSLFLRKYFSRYLQNHCHQGDSVGLSLGYLGFHFWVTYCFICPIYIEHYMLKFAMQSGELLYCVVGHVCSSVVGTQCLRWWSVNELME